MNEKNKLNIRKAEIEDVEIIASLSEELGYIPAKNEIENKLHKFNMDSNEEVFVAQYERVVGWMHLSLVEPLESVAFVEIRGIVVNKDFRKRGIGTGLIQMAENWARGKGCKKIRIRTNIEREETRKYYSSLNFISKKTQEVFEKEL